MTDDADASLSAFLEALDELDRALVDNIERYERMQRRIGELQDAIRGGRPLIDVVPNENTPLLVQLLTESADSLHEYGSRVRRTEARALYDQGMTMEQIARLFGVSRQRVSVLLRDPELQTAED